ncbi:MAG: cytochrome b [Rhodospirillaceae bacterium]|nr:cytochrome b [Rhodospirillaceae bacterium]
MTDSQTASTPLPAGRYTATAIALHWAIATAALIAVGLALTVERLDLGDTKDALLELHKSVGSLIWVLMVARLGWRLGHPPPAPVVQPAWQRLAAKAVHATLYVLLLAMPVTGYVSVAARGRTTTVFGLFDLPRWVPLDRGLARTAENVHDLGQYALYGLVALHVGAGLYHHFVARDRVLERMWPFGRGRGE